MKYNVITVTRLLKQISCTHIRQLFPEYYCYYCQQPCSWCLGCWQSSKGRQTHTHACIHHSWHSVWQKITRQRFCVKWMQYAGQDSWKLRENSRQVTCGRAGPWMFILTEVTYQNFWAGDEHNLTHTPKRLLWWPWLTGKKDMGIEGGSPSTVTNAIEKQTRPMVPNPWHICCSRLFANTESSKRFAITGLDLRKRVVAHIRGRDSGLCRGTATRTVTGGSKLLENGQSGWHQNFWLEQQDEESYHLQDR